MRILPWLNDRSTSTAVAVRHDKLALEKFQGYFHELTRHRMDINCHARKMRVQLLICNPPMEWIFGWYERLCQPLIEFITHVTSLETPSPPHLGTHCRMEGIFLYSNVSRDVGYEYICSTYLILDP